MKLNWFSPLPPAATDIAHFTTRVLPALSSRAEVTLWTEAAARPSGKARAELASTFSELADIRTFDLGRIDWAGLNRADACIYNIGNNPLFHGAIWQLARRHGGVVILHDTRLHHFFDGIYRVQQRNLPGYLAVMSSYYGENGRRDGADCFRNEARNINEMAEQYPLTEHALENALGVVVHTQQAFAELSERSSRPVAYLPLPFAAPPLRATTTRFLASDTHDATANDTACRLVMFGYLARNRRLEAVLQALHDMPERDRFRLDVFGDILDSEDRIKSQIRELGLKKLVSLRGFASESELDDALSQADLAINLRYPTMGEASGSQLRIWAHALPSLVTSVGWYATLPADAVAFVRADENEVADIRSHLRAFLENPSPFAEMGEQGRKILATQHSPEMYEQGLIEFVTDVKRHRPRAALLGLAERTGEVMSDLFVQTTEREVWGSVAERIRGLASAD